MTGKVNRVMTLWEFLENDGKNEPSYDPYGEVKIKRHEKS